MRPPSGRSSGWPSCSTARSTSGRGPVARSSRAERRTCSARLRSTEQLAPRSARDDRRRVTPGMTIDPELAQRVRLLALDVDGVLTDNGIWLGPIAGERVELKRFDIQDG